MTLGRREFVVTSLAAAAAARGSAGAVCFGVIADVHFGLAPDALPRFEAFMDEVARRRGLGFLIQLGDFCHPLPETQPLLAQYERFAGPRYHVLGNHDMDQGTKAQALANWGAPAAWYSFGAGPFRFIVLDLNHIRKDGAYIDYESGNYFREQSLNWAGPEQLAWLAAELARSEAPTIVFSHQPLGAGEPGSLPECQAEVLEVLRGGPVAACLYGHLHVDRLDVHHGIPCLCINSASYHWAGGMHPYRDPLFAFVELSTDGVMRIEGRWSVYAKDDPRGGPAAATIGADPWILSRRIALAGS